MSWSVAGVGKSDKLGAKLSGQIKGCQLSGPERDIADAVADLIEKALDGNIPASAVRVHAFGSQSVMGQKDAPDRITNVMEIKVEQLGDFVE